MVQEHNKEGPNEAQKATPKRGPGEANRQPKKPKRGQKAAQEATSSPTWHRKKFQRVQRELRRGLRKLERGPQ